MEELSGGYIVRNSVKLWKQIEKIPFYINVLDKTSNSVISHCCFEEDGEKIYQNVKCRWRVIPVAHSNVCFVASVFLAADTVVA